jgi:WD40 repeat protein
MSSPTEPQSSPASSSQVNISLSTSLLLNENRSDCVLWNPNVDNILVSTSLNNIYLWDINNNRPLSLLRSHSEAIQGVSWKRDGSLIVTTAKDKTMQIVDPRNINKNEHLV